ncbi:MAG: tripartite tricarboxylate transporter permease [Negativicutes bacterium]
MAGPESANNAAAAGAMVPLLALGHTFCPGTAVLLGGLMIHGVAPGPTFITGHSQFFWLVVASMYIGNVMLLILNLPLVGLFASLTKVPPKILIPIVTSIMFIGAYSRQQQSVRHIHAAVLRFARVYLQTPELFRDAVVRRTGTGTGV